MRIALLVSNLTDKHGWGNYSLNLIAALKRTGHDLRIVVPSNNQAEDEQIIAKILPSIAPQAPYFLLKMGLILPEMRSLLADCDIVHSTIEAYAPLAKTIAGQRPYFITAHGSYVNLPRTRAWPISELYRQAFRQSQLLCVSRYTERVAQEIIPDIRTKVIPNAVDFEQFAPLERRLSEAPTILSAGGVKHRKGTLSLVRAVAKIRETIPDIQCVVLGTLSAEAAYVESVRQEIEALGLSANVRLLGFVDNATLLHYYSTAHIFVLPSINSAWKFEGFGLVHLEASAAGMPVIGTSDCGAEDAIEHGITGLLVSQANVETDLAPAILELLNNPEKARQMGAAGREKARQQTWDKVATQVLDAYKAALK
jgi:phosphatidylinositol alpha-1,6-mannosyltransferase